MSISRLAGLFVCLALWLATAAAEVAVPALQARVTDLTGTLSADQRSALEAELQAFEVRNGSQIAVLLVPTTQPEAIEQYSIRVVEAWKLGRKGKDNGLLVLVAKNDHKVRIEVGYGLEGDIPDASAKRVVDELITPRFKQGDFAGGLTAGVQRLEALIEGKAAPAAKPADAVPAAPGQRSVGLPSHSGPVTDLTDTLSDDQAAELAKRIDDFYASGRTKPLFVLVVPTTQPDAIGPYAARILKTWGEEDNLDVDRSLLLVVAKNEGKAWIEAGAGLRQRMAPGAAERLVAETIEPQLRKGDLAGAVTAGEAGIEKLIDGAIANKTFKERAVDEASSLPVWLLVALVAIGTGVRRLLGPLFGGAVMGAAVGAGAWYVAGTIEVAVAAGFLAFIFVLVGLANWIGMALSGSSGGGGGGGGGGFSGGGGGFGGGGASGSW